MLSCMVAGAQAQVQDKTLDDARARLSRHDAAGAYALLAPLEPQRAGDARFDYLLGVAALDSGHVTRAIFALERIVALQPSDTLARAELGRAYLAAGEPQAAREQLRLARQGDVPPDASAALGRVLGLIDQMAPASPLRLSGYLEFGAAYDSNVNSATSQGEFAIPAFGGILFQTTPETRQRRDIAASVTGGVSAEAALSPAWAVVAATNLRGNVNEEVHAMDTVFLDATLGLRRTVGAQRQMVALQNNTAWVGGSRYRTASGLSAQWQSQLDAQSQGSVFGQWSRQLYLGQAERNTDRSLLGLGVARQLGAGLAYGSGYAVQEHARQAESAHFGHHGWGLRLGSEWRMGGYTVAFLEWQHERRRYGGTEPFFDTTRRDRQDDGVVGMRFRTNSPWQVTTQIRRSRAASNVVLYDYSRSVFQITVSRNFP